MPAASPTVVSTSLAPATPNIEINRNIVVTFDASVQPGSGSITLKKADGTVIAVYDALSSANLNFSGNTLTIDPTAMLEYGTSYIVELATGSVKHIEANVDYPFTASGQVNLQFTTIPESQLPKIAISSNKSSLIADDTATITFTLSEPLATFTADSVTVSGGTLSNFSGNGSVYTANLSPVANSITAAVVSVTDGAFTNAGGYANADGRDPDNRLVIPVDSQAPTKTSSNPANNATGVVPGSNFELSFSEAIALGSGNIVLKSASGDTIATYPVATSTGLSISGTTLSINTGASLVSGRDYVLEFDSRAITDLVGNPYVAESYKFTTAIDNTPPTIAIGSNKTGLIAVDVTGAVDTATISFTLSEPSSTFSQSVVSVTGGTLTGWTGTGMSYAATFTPLKDRTTPAVISVASGAFTDAAGNRNADGAESNNSLTLAVDTEVPTVKGFSPADDATAVGVSSNIMVSFNEPITAGSGKIVLKAPGLPDVIYDAATSTNLSIVDKVLTIVPSAGLQYSTDYKVEFDSGSLKDFAGNPYAGTKSYNFSTVADIFPPTIAIVSNKSSLIKGETATLTFTLSEPSTNFSTSKISVVGGTLSSPLVPTGVSGTVYTATFTPTANSTTAAVISVPSNAFTDAAGNANIDGTDANNRVSLAVDMAVPTVTSFSPAESASGVPLTSNIVLKFSEPIVRGTGTIVLKAGTTTIATYDAVQSPNLNIAGNTLTIDPSADFLNSTTYSVEFAAGTVKDLAGNPYGGTTAYSFQTLADTIAPTVTITSSKSSLIAGETATLTFTLSEPSTTFLNRSVVVTGGTLGNLSGNAGGTVYTATFTPTADSTTPAVISVPSGAFFDTALVPNANADGADISKRLTLSIDTRSPTVLSFSPADEATGVDVASNIVLTFSEAIARGTGNILLKTAAGATIATYDAAKSTNLNIAGNTLTIDPDANLALGTVYKVEFPAGALKDLVGNPYAGTTQYNFLTVPDTTPPTIAVSSDKPSVRTGATATITFTLSEPSTNFIASDVTVSGGTIGALTLVTGTNATGRDYTAVFTPAANSTSTAIISVASGKFSDAAGNQNADGADNNNRVSIAVDTVAPTVTTFSPADKATAVAVGSNIVVTFNEPIALGTGNVVLKTAAGVIAGTYDVAKSTNLSVSGKTLTIDPSTDLLNSTDYKIEFPAASIKDIAGNPYAGSSTYTFRTAPDTTPPTIAITSNKTSLMAGQTATITFTLSEPSTTFTVADVVATGGTLSNFAAASTGTATGTTTATTGTTGTTGTSGTTTTGTTTSGTGATAGTVYTATFTPAVNSVVAGVVSVASGTFTDAASNANVDGADANNRLSITVDTVAPAVATFSPADEAKSVNPAANIVVIFNEAVTKGTGNIVLKTAAGTTIATYDAATSTNLSITGNKLTVNPTADLSPNTEYKLEIAAGTIKDVVGNAYAGSTSYNFTTGAKPVNQVLAGSATNDSIASSTGNDTINGGAGTDTVVYTGPLSNYTITKTSTGYTVQDGSGNDGTDLVSNCEVLKFADKSINLTVQAKAAAASAGDVQSLNELYVAFYNRVPDADGMAYWLDQLAAGQSLSKIAESFYDAGVKLSSVTGYTAGMSNTAFIDVIYRNVLGRANGADKEGSDYWAGELASGKATRASLVATILSVAHSFKGDADWGWVPDLLDNKIAVAKMVSIDLGLNFNTASESVSKGIAIASAITPASAADAITLIGLSSADIQLT